MPSNTFAKLPVHVLINDLKKLDPKSSLQLKTHHLVMWPTSTSRSKHFCTFLKLPVSALINDPQKKWQASTRAHDPFFDILKIWPTFIYRGEVPSNTFAKLPVCALINDPQKINPKIHYTNKPIIWSCDLLPQVGQSIFAHLQSFLCVLLLMTCKKKVSGIN